MKWEETKWVNDLKSREVWLMKTNYVFDVGLFQTVYTRHNKLYLDAVRPLRYTLFDKAINGIEEKSKINSN